MIASLVCRADLAEFFGTDTRSVIVASLGSCTVGFSDALQSRVYSRSTVDQGNQLSRFCASGGSSVVVLKNIKGAKANDHLALTWQYSPTDPPILLHRHEAFIVPSHTKEL